MKQFGIVVHGGAGPDNEFIQEHEEAYKKGIEAAINAGYSVLEKNGSALDAVQAAVRSLEDNPLFNAGKGSSLNMKAEIEMGASIMDGRNLESGAVAGLKDIRNPIALAHAVMDKSKHIFLAGEGVNEFAKEIDAPKEPTPYFITPHAYELYESKKQEMKEKGNERMHGTVGAVALDKDGNLAAATSTGGTEYCYPGRVPDTSMPGVGTYAQNETCAVSATGDGEYHIRFVTAFHISALMEYKGMALKEAAEFLIHEKYKEAEGSMGLIGIDKTGEVALVFNSERMHRGFKTSNGESDVKVY